ncbi:MAG: tetratricopeptide repeat protein [bacterium]
MRKKDVTLSLLLVMSALFLVSFFSPCASSKNMQQGETVQEKGGQQAQLDSTQLALRKKYYSQGYEFWKNRMYSEALEPLHKVIEIDSSYTNAYFYLADSYVRLQDFDNAQMVYESGLEVDPENKYFHRGLAYVLFAKGLEEEAIPEYEIVVADFPEESQYNRILATLYLKYGNEEGAIEQYEQAVEVDLKARDRLIEERKKALAEKGQEDSRVKEYTTKIEALETQLQGDLPTLVSLYKRNEMDVKLPNIYLNYLKLDSTDTEAMLNLGKQYYDLGENEKAIESLTHLIELEAENVLAYQYLGGSYLNLKKNAEAIAAYKKVIGLDPKNKKGYADLASAYNEMGQFDAAERYVKRAIKLDSDYGYAHVVYGEIYEARATPHIDEKGRVPYKWALVFEKAVEEFEKAMKDPEWRRYAEGKKEYLKQFTPTDEQRFFHGGQEGDREPEEDNE